MKVCIPKIEITESSEYIIRCLHLGKGLEGLIWALEADKYDYYIIASFVKRRWI